MTRAKYNELLLAKDKQGNLRISTDIAYKNYIDKVTEQFTSTEYYNYVDRQTGAMVVEEVQDEYTDQDFE